MILRRKRLRISNYRSFDYLNNCHGFFFQPDDFDVKPVKKESIKDELYKLNITKLEEQLALSIKLKEKELKLIEDNNNVMKHRLFLLESMRKNDKTDKKRRLKMRNRARKIYEAFKLNRNSKLNDSGISDCSKATDDNRAVEKISREDEETDLEDETCDIQLAESEFEVNGNEEIVLVTLEGGERIIEKEHDIEVVKKDSDDKSEREKIKVKRVFTDTCPEESVKALKILKTNETFKPIENLAKSIEGIPELEEKSNLEINFSIGGDDINDRIEGHIANHLKAMGGLYKDGDKIMRKIEDGGIVEVAQLGTLKGFEFEDVMEKRQAAYNVTLNKLSFEFREIKGYHRSSWLRDIEQVNQTSVIVKCPEVKVFSGFKLAGFEAGFKAMR